MTMQGTRSRRREVNTLVYRAYKEGPCQNIWLTWVATYMHLKSNVFSMSLKNKNNHSHLHVHIYQNNHPANVVMFWKARLLPFKLWGYHWTRWVFALRWRYILPWNVRLTWWTVKKLQTYLYPFLADIDFRRQILTSMNVRIWCKKSISAMKE